MLFSVKQFVLQQLCGQFVVVVSVAGEFCYLEVGLKLGLNEFFLLRRVFFLLANWSEELEIFNFSPSTLPLSTVNN